MRIRKRHPFSLSTSQNPNFPLLFKPPSTSEQVGLHSNGLSIDPSPYSDLHPKPSLKKDFKEEREVELDFSSTSSDKTMDPQVYNNEREEIERNADMMKEEAMNGKKRRAPPVLMEGSRCSRVNGRGWRCSQHTLIGYSLCEHHHGKGRLRSVNASNQVIKKGTRKPKKKIWSNEV